MAKAVWHSLRSKVAQLCRSTSQYIREMVVECCSNGLSYK
jgi:hypothetical protein